MCREAVCCAHVTCYNEVMPEFAWNVATMSITRNKLTHLLIIGAFLLTVAFMVGGMWRWGVAVLVLTVIPALLLHAWAPPPPSQRALAWLAGALVGPSLIAVIYVWAATLGWAVPVSGLWWLLLGAGAWWGWRWWRQALPGHGGWSLPQWHWWVVLVVLVGLVVWTRQQQIASLVLPAWVDGVHHALLIRVAYETQRAPLDLTPYLPVTALTFHSGYHSIMALLLAWSGIDLDALGTYVLVSGQVLNLCAVVSVALLAWYWWRSPLALAAAVTIGGLVTIMPAYYVAWGRYTLLMGMIWLPVAVMLADALWHSTTPRLWVWCGIVGAGLALIHMVIFVMWLAWILVLWVSRGWPSRGIWYSGGLALLLTVPWWWLVITHTRGGAGASAMHVVGNSTHNAFIAGLFWALNNQWLIPAMLVVVAWALWRRSQIWARLVLWSGVIAFLANPIVVGLPYISFFTNETMSTALYVPIALSAAWLMHLLQRWVMPALLVGVLLVGGVIGAQGMQTVVRAETVMSTADDVRVLEWAQQQSWPADTVVLTGAQGWMWGVDRGVDGGWWMLPLVGVTVTTPPVLYTYAPDDWVADASQLSAAVRTSDGTEAGIRAIVIAHPGITHIYASERSPTLKPSQLALADWLDVVYQSGDVTLFRVKRPLND